MREKKHRGIIWYGIAFVSVLGLVFCAALLFPGGRTAVIKFTERFVFLEQLKPRYIAEAHELLAAFAPLCFFLIAVVDFFALTRAGNRLLVKTGFLDVTEADIVSGLKMRLKKIREKRFEVFCVIAGGAVFTVAVSRAANTGMTYDEAATYINYVLGGVIKGIFSRQFLNNHILNSVLIRIVCLVTQIKYNEFFIRLPSLVFYAVYIVFSCRAAGLSRYRYFVFVLCVSNYCVNEYFSLARGYGMAASCMLGAFCYFDAWRKNNDEKNLKKFLLWASLAALANGIALYSIFCVLAILVFKYRKNPFRLSNLAWFLIFLFSALFVVIMGRNGRPVASTHNFYDSMGPAVFGTLVSNNSVLTFLVFAFFLAAAAFVLFKTKFTNDYTLIYLIFMCVSFVSNMIFRKGYPLSREMIPFFPLVVFIMIETLRLIKPNTATGISLSALSILLCFQFVAQININGVAELEDSYPIRREIFEYLNTGNKDAAAYEEFIDHYRNPVADFYRQKYDMLLREQK
jgi:hypothetical protein